jgi:hypothetical protein
MVREAAIAWLDVRPTELVDFAWLSTFEYDDRRLPLMDRQRAPASPPR